jgi:hypothetical protein
MQFSTTASARDAAHTFGKRVVAKPRDQWNAAQRGFTAADSSMSPQVGRRLRTPNQLAPVLLPVNGEISVGSTLSRKPWKLLHRGRFQGVDLFRFAAILKTIRSLARTCRRCVATRPKLNVGLLKPHLTSRVHDSAMIEAGVETSGLGPEGASQRQKRNFRLSSCGIGRVRSVRNIACLIADRIGAGLNGDVLYQTVGCIVASGCRLLS